MQPRRPYCPVRAYHANRIYAASLKAGAVLITAALVLLLASLVLALCYPNTVTVSMGVFFTGLALIPVAALAEYVGLWFYRRA